MQQLQANDPFYQISQASKILGITCDRLRTYEEEGLIKPYRIKHSKDGKRLFSQNDIEWLSMIRDLIKLGVSIPTIRVLLAAKYQGKSKQLKQRDLEIIAIVNKLKKHEVYGMIFN
jgi:DNA-binding transcriptional MerR regulator